MGMAVEKIIIFSLQCAYIDFTKFIFYKKFFIVILLFLLL